MTNFYKLNEQKLRDKFQKQLDEMGGLGSVGDPHSKETMFSSFVLQEDAAAKQGSGQYKLAVVNGEQNSDNIIDHKLIDENRIAKYGPLEATPEQQMDAAIKAINILRKENLIDVDWLDGYGGIDSEYLPVNFVAGSREKGGHGDADPFGDSGIRLWETAFKPVENANGFEFGLYNLGHELRHYYGPNMRAFRRSRMNKSKEDYLSAQNDANNYGYRVLEAWRKRGNWNQ
jgi:hypothetical protein